MRDNGRRTRRRSALTAVDSHYLERWMWRSTGKECAHGCDEAANGRWPARGHQGGARHRDAGTARRWRAAGRRAQRRGGGRDRRCVEGRRLTASTESLRSRLGGVGPGIELLRDEKAVADRE